MGNCTSKKSRKSLKLSVAKKSMFLSKMDKEQDTQTKGLSKKVAPFTKGEVTSFGFKKKISSQLPIPITLTSNGHSIREPNEKDVQNGVSQKYISDGYHSGSSVESLCHAPFRSTPKMVRKSRDVVKQTIPAGPVGTEYESNSKTIKTVPTSLPLRNENNNGSSGNIGKTNLELGVNRFGFRQPTPPRATNNTGKSLKHNGGSHNPRTAFLAVQNPFETESNSSIKRFEVSTRSRSEGPREAFFKQNLLPSNSVQSGLNQSKVSLNVNNLQPGKFTFQTSHLPRPQFPVKMTDTKTAKTAANYHRRGGVRSASSSSVNEDSGFESQPSANNTLEWNIEILSSSPGCKVRQRLPAFKGKKLQMKVVGNKFELLKKEDETNADVTEVSVIELPASNIRSGTAIISTGLVEQRTTQYLKKISQPFNKKESDVGANNLNKTPSKPNAKISVDLNNRDEGLGAESEEEKLFKDSKKSEKTSIKYSMSYDCGDAEDMLPGETMAEGVSVGLKFDEEITSECTFKIFDAPNLLTGIDATPNSIRLDALKLSKVLKYKNNVASTNRKVEDSAAEFLMACEKDEDTFPSDSILEQLSDSDSLGDKGENKNNDKEKNFKIANLNLDKEDLGIELDEEEHSKSGTDIDENDLELNIDETEIKDNKNCLGSTSPGSPGTPTPASNSLSLSDGRDFLIDDEIADQPLLCLSESYVDCSYQEEAKTSNERTVTVNNEFVTCCDVQTNTVEAEDENEKFDENAEEVDKDYKVNERVVNKGERRRLNSEGTLSPCESITSDDLMLDFETNSLEETSGRYEVNESSSVENVEISLNADNIRDVSCHRLNARSGGERPIKRKEGNSNCSTPASAKSLEMVSHNASNPYRSSRSTPADEDSLILDKISCQNMFQDIIGIKAMLLKLKRLLLESEGGLQENGRIYLGNGTLDNVMEDELTDLRRQVLFLQQQLEEREKMVQVLRLKVNQASEPGTETPDSKKQTNAATQTGLDQFQQDFPHFRIFQTTPVI